MDWIKQPTKWQTHAASAKVSFLRHKNAFSSLFSVCLSFRPPMSCIIIAKMSFVPEPHLTCVCVCVLVPRAMCGMMQKCVLECSASECKKIAFTIQSSEPNDRHIYLPRNVCSLGWGSIFLIHRPITALFSHSSSLRLAACVECRAGRRRVQVNVNEAEEKCVLWQFYDVESGICMEINIRITLSTTR